MRLTEILEGVNSPLTQVRQAILDVLIPLKQSGVSSIRLDVLKNQLYQNPELIVPDDESDLVAIVSEIPVVDHVETDDHNGSMTVYFSDDTTKDAEPIVADPEEDATDQHISKVATKQANDMLKQDT